MKHQTRTLTLTLTLGYLSHHYDLPMNPQTLPEMVRDNLKEG